MGDAIAIPEYISRDGSPLTAVRSTARLESSAGKSTITPSRGRIVPELRELGVTAYRELIVAPWRIICRIENRKVFVVEVIDSRRDLEELLYERLLIS